MAIDVFQEKLLGMTEATKRLPKGCHNKRISIATLYRWVQRGCRSKDGQVVRLEIVMVGGHRCTSEEALQRFFDRLTGDQSVVTPPSFTRRQRLRQIREAEKVLERAGF